MEDDSWWKQTAEMFTPMIDKPKMVEKYLVKPPPKYLYEIIMNTLKKTGFPNGLFTDEELELSYFEANPNNKLNFFQKVKDITVIVLNEKFELNLKSLLRGEEPDKTNYFIRAFGKAAFSGKDYKKYIDKYLEHRKSKEAGGNKDEGKADNKKIEEKKPEEIKKPEVKKVEEAKKQEKVQKLVVDSNKGSSETVKVSKNISNKAQVTKNTEIKIEDKKEEPVNKAGKVLERQNLEDEKVDDDLRNANVIDNIKLNIKLKPDVVSIDNQKIQVNIEDIDAIKNYIQEITKGANPIGKLIDLMPDDIDAMNKELLQWIKEGKEYKDQYSKEVKKTEEVLLPLQSEYIELEETIRDEIMKIRNLKTRIIKNERVINNLVNTVISIKK